MKNLIVFTMLAALSPAFADRVALKSGSSLTGTVVGVNDKEVVFKSDDLGEVKIPVAKIAALENAGKHTVQFNDNRRVEKRMSVKDGAFLADAEPLDMKSVKAIDPKVETWHGSVNASFLASRGNTYENSWSVVANVNRRWEKDRFNGDIGYYYSKKGPAGEDAEKSTDRWEVELKHDHFWWEKVYSYEDLRYDRDMIQELEARYRLGIGGGYQWLEKTEALDVGRFSFNQEFGVNYVKENYEHNDDEKQDGFAALRYGHHFGWLPKWREGLEVFHNFEILPEVDEWEKFLAKADAGFSTKLIYDFDLLCKIEWNYNSQPASGRKKDDLRYTVGLGYKW